MFDIGWTEILVVVIIAVVVVGPKELPRALVSVGRWVAKGRSLAREFQDGVQTVMRQAELEELRIDLPDPKSILGDNPIAEGKSILGGADPVPEDHFIDDQIIAEMEKADAETSDMLRHAAGEAADRARDAGNGEAEAEAEQDSPAHEIAGDDGRPEPSPSGAKPVTES